MLSWDLISSLAFQPPARNPAQYNDINAAKLRMEYVTISTAVSASPPFGTANAAAPLTDLLSSSSPSSSTQSDVNGRFPLNPSSSSSSSPDQRASQLHLLHLRHQAQSSSANLSSQNNSLPTLPPRTSVSISTSAPTPTTTASNIANPQQSPQQSASTGPAHTTANNIGAAIRQFISRSDRGSAGGGTANTAAARASSPSLSMMTSASSAVVHLGTVGTAGGPPPSYGSTSATGMSTENRSRSEAGPNTHHHNEVNHAGASSSSMAVLSAPNVEEIPTIALAQQRLREELSLQQQQQQQRQPNHVASNASASLPSSEMRVAFVRFLPKGVLPGTPLVSPMLKGSGVGTPLSTTHRLLMGSSGAGYGGGSGSSGITITVNNASTPLMRDSAASTATPSGEGRTYEPMPTSTSSTAPLRRHEGEDSRTEASFSANVSGSAAVAGVKSVDGGGGSNNNNNNSGIVTVGLPPLAEYGATSRSSLTPSYASTSAYLPCSPYAPSSPPASTTYAALFSNGPYSHNSVGALDSPSFDTLQQQRLRRQHVRGETSGGSNNNSSSDGGVLCPASHSRGGGGGAFGRISGLNSSFTVTNTQSNRNSPLVSTPVASGNSAATALYHQNQNGGSGINGFHSQQNPHLHPQTTFTTMNGLLPNNTATINDTSAANNNNTVHASMGVSSSGSPTGGTSPNFFDSSASSSHRFSPANNNSNYSNSSHSQAYHHRQLLYAEAVTKWPGGVILYAHGAGEDIPSSYAYFESLATETQCLVVAFDYFGYGYSSGQKQDCTEANAYLAIEGVFNHLTKNLKIDARRIVLMGRSLGTGPVVELAHRESTRLQGLAGVILISPMYSAASVVKYGSYIPNFLDIFNNHSKIASINTCPIMIIHGDKDEVIPYWHAEKLYDLAYNARREQQNERLGIPNGIIARGLQKLLPAVKVPNIVSGFLGTPRNAPPTPASSGNVPNGLTAATMANSHNSANTATGVGAEGPTANPIVARSTVSPPSSTTPPPATTEKAPTTKNTSGAIGSGFLAQKISNVLKRATGGKQQNLSSDQKDSAATATVGVLVIPANKNNNNNNHGYGSADGVRPEDADGDHLYQYTYNNGRENDADNCASKRVGGGGAREEKVTEEEEDCDDGDDEIETSHSEIGSVITSRRHHQEEEEEDRYKSCESNPNSCRAGSTYYLSCEEDDDDGELMYDNNNSGDVCQRDKGGSSRLLTASKIANAIKQKMKSKVTTTTKSAQLASGGCVTSSFSAPSAGCVSGAPTAAAAGGGVLLFSSSASGSVEVNKAKQNPPKGSEKNRLVLSASGASPETLTKVNTTSGAVGGATAAISSFFGIANVSSSSSSSYYSSTIPSPSSLSVSSSPANTKYSSVFHNRSNSNVNGEIKSSTVGSARSLHSDPPAVRKDISSSESDDSAERKMPRPLRFVKNLLANKKQGDESQKEKRKLKTRRGRGGGGRGAVSNADDDDEDTHFYEADPTIVEEDAARWRKTPLPEVPTSTPSAKGGASRLEKIGSGHGKTMIDAQNNNNKDNNNAIKLEKSASVTTPKIPSTRAAPAINSTRSHVASVPSTPSVNTAGRTCPASADIIMCTSPSSSSCASRLNSATNNNKLENTHSQSEIATTDNFSAGSSLSPTSTTGTAAPMAAVPTRAPRKRPTTRPKVEDTKISAAKTESQHSHQREGGKTINEGKIPEADEVTISSVIKPDHDQSGSRISQPMTSNTQRGREQINAVTGSGTNKSTSEGSATQSSPTTIVTDGMLFTSAGAGSVVPQLPIPKFSPPSAIVLLTVEGCGHHDLEFRRGRHLYAQINGFLSDLCGQQNHGGVVGARTLMALSAGLSAAKAITKSAASSLTQHQQHPHATTNLPNAQSRNLSVHPDGARGGEEVRDGAFLVKKDSPTHNITPSSKAKALYNYYSISNENAADACTQIGKRSALGTRSCDDEHHRSRSNSNSEGLNTCKCQMAATVASSCANASNLASSGCSLCKDLSQRAFLSSNDSICGATASSGAVISATTLTNDPPTCARTNTNATSDSDETAVESVSYNIHVGAEEDCGVVHNCLGNLSVEEGNCSTLASGRATPLHRNQLSAEYPLSTSPFSAIGAPSFSLQQATAAYSCSPGDHLSHHQNANSLTSSMENICGGRISIPTNRMRITIANSGVLGVPDATSTSQRNIGLFSSSVNSSAGPSTPLTSAAALPRGYTPSYQGGTPTLRVHHQQSVQINGSSSPARSHVRFPSNASNGGSARESSRTNLQQSPYMSSAVYAAYQGNYQQLGNTAQMGEVSRPMMSLTRPLTQTDSSANLHGLLYSGDGGGGAGTPLRSLGVFTQNAGRTSTAAKNIIADSSPTTIHSPLSQSQTRLDGSLTAFTDDFNAYEPTLYNNNNNNNDTVVSAPNRFPVGSPPNNNASSAAASYSHAYLSLPQHYDPLSAPPSDARYSKH